MLRRIADSTPVGQVEVFWEDYHVYAWLQATQENREEVYLQEAPWLGAGREIEGRCGEIQGYVFDR